MEIAARRPDRHLASAVIGPLVVALAAMIGCYCGLDAGTCFDVAWTAAALSGTIGCLGARQQARPENRARWTLWTIATGSWLVGQLVWDAYGFVGFPHAPSVADVGWWGFALLVMVGVLRFPRSARSILAVALAESVPLICAAISLCLALLWSAYTHSTAPTPSRLSDLVYPCLYASATILIVQAMLGGALRGLQRLPLRLVLGGTAAISLAFMLWSRELLHGTYVAGTSVLDPLWVLGLGAVAVGGLLTAREPEEAPTLEEPDHMGVVLPAGMFTLLFGALLIEVISGAAHRVDEILVLGILCSGTAMIVRSGLLSGRLRELLGRERIALAQLVEREAELARLNAQLVEDSRHDPLTGIGNRRALSDDLPMYKTLQRETGEVIAVLLCDIDHFKSYNDRFGHLAGDRALCMIAATARGTLQGRDAAYRYGGEELLLILRGTGPEAAQAVAERVREAVQHAGVRHPLADHGVLTVSVGLACGLEPPEELLERADRALYEAKESGRNRVVVADPTTSALAPGRVRPDDGDEPVPRHLRSMLSVSRAAASGLGVRPVLEALADALRGELSFNVVAVNLRESTEWFRTVIVLGDPSARAVLLDTTLAWPEWEEMTRAGRVVHGATWLPAGSYDPDTDSVFWRAPMVAPLAPDGWDPDDMLLLPLRSATQEVLGFVSVDQPMLGRRPTDAEISVLMAVVDHAALAVEQIQQHDAAPGHESDALRLAAVMLLAEALDLRDPSTASHSRTVGRLARLTAVELGLPEPRIERVHAAGVLHDLGKLSIPDAILQKPAALDAAEWREMRRHPEVGARILEHAGMRDIAAWVRVHHERVDGQGYPRGLPREAISLEARILSVADAYEAMIADRPYRTGMSPDAARAELQRCVGTQFDPQVVAAFLRALDAERVQGDAPDPASGSQSDSASGSGEGEREGDGLESADELEPVAGQLPVEPAVAALGLTSISDRASRYPPSPGGE
jgi:diguanylate cyclase (GGDEF)-like protein